jgi:DNA polymerase III epsilon subunit-like protein
MSLVLHFVDTETSGLEPLAGCEVLEYAVVRWCDGETETLVHTYVEPKHYVPAKVAKINGYAPELWRKHKATHWALSDGEVLAKLLDGAMIAGSNPDFDKRMIAAEMNRMGQAAPKWSHRSLNTASLGMPLHMLGAVESCGLDALGKYFGLETQEHTALADCYRAIAVWEGLFDLYIHQPKVMRDGLIEIANDELTDSVLRDYALKLSRGEGA